MLSNSSNSDIRWYESSSEPNALQGFTGRPRQRVKPVWAFLAGLVIGNVAGACAVIHFWVR